MSLDVSWSDFPWLAASGSSWSGPCAAAQAPPCCCRGPPGNQMPSQCMRGLTSEIHIHIHICILSIYIYIYVWLSPTPLKNDRVKVSWDDDIPNVPNHQTQLQLSPESNYQTRGEEETQKGAKRV